MQNRNTSKAPISFFSLIFEQRIMWITELDQLFYYNPQMKNQLIQIKYSIYWMAVVNGNLTSICCSQSRAKLTQVSMVFEETKISRLAQFQGEDQSHTACSYGHLSHYSKHTLFYSRQNKKASGVHSQNSNTVEHCL